MSVRHNGACHFTYFSDMASYIEFMSKEIEEFAARGVNIREASFPEEHFAALIHNSVPAPFGDLIYASGQFPKR